MSMTTPNRRVLLAAALVIVVAVAGLLFWRSGSEETAPAAKDPFPGLWLNNTDVLGDADGDGALSEPEAQDLAATEKSSHLIAEQIAPTKGLNTLLITPAGDRWWALVTGLSAQTGNWGTSAPTDGVDWYAYTESRAYHPVDGGKRPYDALHLAFESQDAAEAWMGEQAKVGGTATSNITFRGRVVTLTPSWVEATSEPFGAVDAAALADIDVRLGMWQTDFSEQIEMRAEEAVTPQVYREVFRNFGFGDGATWTATSAAPDAIWRGKITGFDPKKVNVAEAIGRINTSYTECKPSSPNGCGSGQGMSDATNMMWAAVGNEGGGEQMLMPKHAPDDTDLTLALDGGWRGAVRGDAGFVHSPISVIEMWVTDGQTLAIHPVLGSGPEKTS